MDRLCMKSCVWKPHHDMKDEADNAKEDGRDGISISMAQRRMMGGVEGGRGDNRVWMGKNHARTKIITS